ncbi:MAG TPA: AP2 domain-containing protein [Nitrospiraceae bacterium]|nr:AP2 domain-containing protein [Nitrospiraceae bacterium]
MADANHTTESSAAQPEEYWNCVCIPISKGKYTIVDTEDFPLISSYSWQAKNNRGRGYYARTKVQINGDKLGITLHQMLFKELVDHKDLDGLNNRRNNLRPCTHAQNQRNRPKRRGTHSSKFKGVYWNKREKKWVACMSVNDRTLYLGIFTDEVDAAKAYNQAAIRHSGEFAWLNPIPATERISDFHL